MTTYLASHQGPGGTICRSEHAEWTDAADWLRAMMQIHWAAGGKLVMPQLNGMTRGCDFMAEADDHWFSLAQVDAPAAAASGCQ
jgi:hypothetical protein